MFNVGDFVYLTIENGDGGTAVILDKPRNNFCNDLYVVYSNMICGTMTVYEFEMFRMEI